MTLPKGIKLCVPAVLALSVSFHTYCQAPKTISPDSLRILTWHFNTQWMQKDTLLVDTLLNSFQVFNPVDKDFISYAYLGNLGLPAMNTVFSQQHFSSPFILMHPLEPYLVTPENTLFFNTRRPFTSLHYSNGGPSDKAEEFFNVTHTQDIKSNWNAGIVLNIYASPGLYPNQRTKDRNFVAHTNFQGNKYTLYAAYCLNKFTNQENGGLLNDSAVYDQNQDYLPVKLEYAKNKYLSNTFYLLQSYELGGKINDSTKNSFLRKLNLPLSTFSLLLRYDRIYKSFYDSDLKGYSAVTDLANDSAYFTHTYLNPDITSDSVIFRKFNAQLRYSIREKSQKFPFFISFLLSQELLKYGFYKEAPTPDTLVVKNTTFFTTTLANLRAGAILSFGKPQSWQWRTSGYYTFTGYDFGSYLLQATMSLGLGGKHQNGIRLEFTSRADKPDYLLSNFASNSKIWDNTFKKTIRNEASASFLSDGQAIATADLINLNNFIYFNDSGYPAQYSGNLAVASFIIDKTFHYWKMTSVNKIALQTSTNSRVLPLPAASLFLSNYFEAFLVKNVLLTEIGFDFRYYTSYYGYDYDPVTGYFHTQHEKMLGNYPYVEVFLNLKLKRTRAYLKYEHANYGLMPRNYFNALHYPMTKALFKFGLSWVFYD